MSKQNIYLEKTALRRSNEEQNRITRESLCGAMVLLMMEKDYHTITITELAKRAGVSRNGFYRNYGSKEEILKDMVIEFNKDLYRHIRSFGPGLHPHKWYRQFFRVIREQADPLKTMDRIGFRGQYLQITNEYLMKTYPPASVKERYRMLAWNGAIQNLAFDWICSGMKEDIEEMAGICCDLNMKMEES